jgi:hypothetical protein
MRMPAVEDTAQFRLVGDKGVHFINQHGGMPAVDRAENCRGRDISRGERLGRDHADGG